MATVKVASLLLKTLAKPIANQLKQQAKNHERFRSTTISIAQFMHRSEMHVMRTKLLGETHHPKHIRPLNDVKAIDAGANFISEAFLFSFASVLILAETWRSRRKEGARRDFVADQLEAHENQLKALREQLDMEREEQAQGIQRERDLEKIVEEIVGIGLRGGWLVAPSASADWKAHVQLAQETRETGILPAALVEPMATQSAVLRELGMVSPEAKSASGDASKEI